MVGWMYRSKRGGYATDRVAEEMLIETIAGFRSLRAKGWVESFPLRNASEAGSCQSSSVYDLITCAPRIREE